MSKEIYFYDAAGTRRKVKDIYFYDASAVRRKVKQAYFYDASNVRRQFFAGVVAAWSMTAANPASTLIGYQRSSYGSTTPVDPTVGGNILFDMYTNASSLTFSLLSASDPGQAYFTSLVSGLGTTFLTANASDYTYGGGIARWHWNTTLQYVAGNNYAVSTA